MNWSTNLESPAGGNSRQPRVSLSASRTARKLALSALVLTMAVAIAGGGTWAAFSATTVNTGNSFETGQVSLSNDKGATAMFTMTGMGPGSTETDCLEVTYTGDLTADVVLYGTTGIGGLDPYLDLVVKRSADCADDFSAVVPLYTGTLADYPDDWATGIDDPEAGWTGGKVVAYQFTVTLQDNAAAEGLDVTQDFTWEARTP